jgi:hypothetical protein
MRASTSSTQAAINSKLGCPSNWPDKPWLGHVECRDVVIVAERLELCTPPRQIESDRVQEDDGRSASRARPHEIDIGNALNSDQRHSLILPNLGFQWKSVSPLPTSLAGGALIPYSV